MEKEKLRILLVDQTTEDLSLLYHSLEKSDVPAALKTVSSTEKALKKLGRHNFDLILTEHCPPQINVFRLLQNIQTLDHQTPVILLTRTQEIDVVRRAFRLGVGDFLLKEELEAVSFFDIISTVLTESHQSREKNALQKELQDRANRDGLTGLTNHRCFLEILEKEFIRSSRYWRPLSLLMIDLDGFKTINDNLGHQKGDAVLARISTLLRKSVRDVDTVARYGGDEFAILLPETDLEAARNLAERVLTSIGQSPFLDGQKIFPLSASIGVASYHPALLGPGALLQGADQALYLAKRSGRNRVQVCQKPPSGECESTPLSRS